MSAQPRSAADFMRVGMPNAVHRFSAPLLHLIWDDHLMFCAPACLPVASYLAFGDFLKILIPSVFGEHPDFSRIDWSRAQWSKNDEFWMPRSELSLRDNGVRHNDVVRLKTPGLTGLNCSSS
jgi:phenol/toluene 2-monooxygenase (NADH) P4/A4